MDVPPLASDEVHVWLLRLPAPGGRACDQLLARVRPQLSPEEQARADKFQLETARVQFVVARVALRRLLASYCQVEPHTLMFGEGARGKPHARDQPIDFNVSHSGRVALIALTRDRELGVDVEHVWQDKDPYALADRYFSPAELSALDAVDPAQRTRAFFAIWSRKEAYIKARGDGLHLALDSFDVTCGLHPRLLASRHHPADVQRFCMFDLAIDDEYPACLVVEAVSRTAGLSEPSNPPELRLLELALELL